jgi:hypothetical protein
MVARKSVKADAPMRAAHLIRQHRR